MKRILIACFLFTPSLFAQVDTASIVGTVRDQSGAAVPSATITIVQKATNASTAVQTNQNGEYLRRRCTSAPTA